METKTFWTLSFIVNIGVGYYKSKYRSDEMNWDSYNFLLPFICITYNHLEYEEYR